jgi:hypothetical protein
VSAAALAFVNRETADAPLPPPCYDAVGAPLLLLRLLRRERTDLEDLIDRWPALSRPAERRSE